MVDFDAYEYSIIYVMILEICNNELTHDFSPNHIEGPVAMHYISQFCELYYVTLKNYINDISIPGNFYKL